MSGTQNTYQGDSQGRGPGGKKDDAGKVRWDLLPRGVLLGVAQVLTFGAAKYDVDSWQKVPDGFRRYLAGQERHLQSVLDGEQFDQESKCHHAYHYVCNAMFIAWIMVFRPDEVRAYAVAQRGENGGK